MSLIIEACGLTKSFNRETQLMILCLL